VVGAAGTVSVVYVPSLNAVDDPTVIVGLLRTAGVGHLVSTTDSQLDATMLPLLVDDEMTSLRAHIARANPHWRTLDDASALMIVPVTDAYVSPSWYPSKADDPRVVPTWNYEVVHVHGTVTLRHDAEFVVRVVRDLTDLHEIDRTRSQQNPPAWSVDDAPTEFIERQLRAIVGIEIAIDRVDAKRKLSQNRSATDRTGVIAGLRGADRQRGAAVADAMER